MFSAWRNRKTAILAVLAGILVFSLITSSAQEEPDKRSLDEGEHDDGDYGVAVESDYLPAPPEVVPLDYGPPPSYGPPPPPPPPAYEQVHPHYQQPPQEYPQPQQPEYQQPQYQAPPPQQIEYQQPQYQAPQQPQYQAPQQPQYQAPQPSQSEYQQPQYQAPQQSREYQQPPQQYHQVEYQAPAYNNHSTATYQSHVQNVILSYPQSTYDTIPHIYQQQTNYVPLKQYYQPLQIKPTYQVQPQNLFYKKPHSAYKTCPKDFYSNPPTEKDVQAAFEWAAQQIAVIKGQAVHYMNSSKPSWASRHQMFSILTSPGVKSDEEGLLIEYASQYISDRLCMSKWDRQKYLPSLSKIASNGNYYPASHSCRYAYTKSAVGDPKYCLSQKYRNIDGYCNNPWHPYWGKSSVCHIRILSPDYADGVSSPRVSAVSGVELPNPRALSEWIHNDIPVWGPYNLLKMQWGQFINHDITNTAVSSYDGLVDCCKNPGVQGCFPIYVPPGDKFYGKYNTTCLNFIRSAVCPICQLGPRQQLNKNTAFLDASHVYGSNKEDSHKVRAFQRGLLKVTRLKSGEIVLPIDSKSHDKSCGIWCFFAGDSRVNQHPALTALHVIALRRHNLHATALAQRHPNWNDETLFQEARRLLIAEYQMITYNEYLPLVFGPQLSAYYKIRPLSHNYTYYNSKTDPTTWNEYVTASCRFGHSQVTNLFSLLKKAIPEGSDQYLNAPGNSFKLNEWFNRPTFIGDGLTGHLINGLVSRGSQAVDQWVVDDLRNYLYRAIGDSHGGDLPATNVQRGRDHGIPGYIHYLEYCSKIRVRTWQDLNPFFEPKTLIELKNMYKFVENIDLFTGGLSEKHAPGADIGLTFACINGIQYYHLKHGDRYYFEHGGQAGSFTPAQLQEIRRTTLAKFLCKTAGVDAVPAFAFLKAGRNNPLVDCRLLPDINYNLF